MQARYAQHISEFTLQIWRIARSGVQSKQQQMAGLQKYAAVAAPAQIMREQ